MPVPAPELSVPDAEIATEWRTMMALARRQHARYTLSPERESFIRLGETAMRKPEIG